MARVQQAASALGLEPTATGRATISCRVSQERFAELFGEPAIAVSARAPGRSDAGTPGGFAEAVLPVPAALAEWVESLSVTPPATRH
ncbi:hypothetical protein [Gemmata massiliana]|uniref:hypothetical protein n=1 Tax=Gemmata massiliana TaxID=1210884 RepID=UPI0013A70B64|nr:hypothetical protein [Gemmata massiliana]